LLAEELELDLYALFSTFGATDLVDATGTPYHRNTATITTIGARAKHKVGMLDYRAEGGIQLGENPGLAPAVPGETATSQRMLAYHGDAEIGLSPVKEVRVSLGGLYASGDDPTTTNKQEGWNELFPTGHKFLGLMDVIGARTNIISGNLKVKANVAASTIVKLDGHLFARAEDGGLGRVGEEQLAGTEVDLQLVQKIGKWAYTRGLYGMFIPLEQHYASDAAVLYGELQAGLKF
jgi:hypothetical protein